MFKPIVIVIGSLLFVMLLVAIAIWWKIVSTSRKVFTDHHKRADEVDPLYLRGTDLFYWATDTAARVVAKYLRGTPNESSPIDLAQELHTATTCGMCPLGSQLDAIDLIPCPKDGLGLIGVTAPEAIEIADYIHRHLPPAEGKRIHDLAHSNALKLANVALSGFDATQTPCPLQGTDGVCLAYLARPLHCRPHHAATIWRQRGLKRSVDEENDFDEQVIKQGADTGLTESLTAAGRDGNVYELNSALVAALDTPDAAKRWTEGEDVFSHCKRYASRPTTA